MIKKLLSIALVVVAVSANAQQFKKSANYKGEQLNASVSSRLAGGNQVLNTIDTLQPASIMSGGCAVGTNTAIAGFASYRWDLNAVKDSGYIFGTGIFPFTGVTVTDIAQRYNSGSVGLTVTNVLTWAAKASGGTATTTASIYDEDATFLSPGTSLGSSSPIAMSAYVQSNNATALNNYVFSTPVSVAANKNFFVTISIPAMGGANHDSMSIVTSRFGCPTTTDSLSWMNLGAFGWYSTINGVFGSNLDIMMWPVVSIPTTGVVAYSKGDLNLYAASPNPTSNSININFTLNNPSKVDIDVVDVTGKLVKSVKGTETFSAAGKHSVTLDVTSLESGSYFYSVTANGTKLFSKFVVTK